MPGGQIDAPVERGGPGRAADVARPGADAGRGNGESGLAAIVAFTERHAGFAFVAERIEEHKRAELPLRIENADVGRRHATGQQLDFRKPLAVVQARDVGDERPLPGTKIVRLGEHRRIAQRTAGEAVAGVNDPRHEQVIPSRPLGENHVEREHDIARGPGDELEGQNAFVRPRGGRIQTPRRAGKVERLPRIGGRHGALLDEDRFLVPAYDGDEPAGHRGLRHATSIATTSTSEVRSDGSIVRPSRLCV